MAESSTSSLERFLALAPSTKGAAAAKVITDATASPGVYVFGRLLDLPNIQALHDDPEHAKHYALLELFAYGTLGEYRAAPDQYPALLPLHLVKLKQLTLVSLALQHRSIPYEQLHRSLEIEDERELEDLVIDVIYAGLLKGKMHQNEKVLHVDWAAGRDLRRQDVAILHQKLQTWRSNTATLLKAIDGRIDDIQRTSQREADDQMAYKLYRNEAFNALMPGISQGSSRSNRGRNQKNEDDFDGMTSMIRAARSGKGGGSLLGVRGVSSHEPEASRKSPKRPREE